MLAMTLLIAPPLIMLISLIYLEHGQGRSDPGTQPGRALRKRKS